MANLPESLFANPVWHALTTRHRHFAQREGDAIRYPAEVAPFVAVAEPNEDALMELHSLILPGESVCLIGDRYPQSCGLLFNGHIGVLQMVLPDEIAAPDPDPKIDILPLSAGNAGEMVALTELAFPGYFRRRTCEMGSYYGVRADGEFIAMGGERLMIDDYAEISGVCTHPKHRGKGLAASLIWQLVRDHRRKGLVSWLHVGSENRRAIDLYTRMGFEPIREVMLHRVSRKS